MNAKRVSLSVVPLLLWANIAAADLVVLTSGGGSFYAGDFGSFHLNGLDTQLAENTRPGSWDPWEFAPGDPVSLKVTITASPFPHQPVAQVVNGTLYHDVFLRGSLQLIGDPFIAPAGVNQKWQGFSAPMTLTGQLSGFSNFEGKGTPVFSVSVAGTGRLFVQRYLFLTSDGREKWALLPGSAGSFELTTSSSSPVPEPATMILLATGLAGASWQSRRLRPSTPGRGSGRERCQSDA